MTFTAGKPFKNRRGNSSGMYKVYATISADVDLLAEGGMSNTPPWKFIVWGAGDLVLQRAGTPPVNVTFPGLPAGALLEDVEAIKIIDTGTTATNIAVFW